MPVPVPEVLAEWAYSEIVDGISASKYVPHVTDELRTKRKTSVPFSLLSQSERYSLARACFRVRPLILIHLIGITCFELVNIARTDLETVLVPPNAARELEGSYVTFAKYMTMPSTDPNDARSDMSSPGDWQPPETPVTLGYFFQHRVLIDGFHRAATFWRCNPARGVLKAYVPQDEPYATL